MFVRPSRYHFLLSSPDVAGGDLFPSSLLLEGALARCFWGQQTPEGND